MAAKKSSIAASFISSPASRKTGGRPCLTCRSPQREEVEKECLAYNRARKTGRTSASWEKFHGVLRAHLGFSVLNWKSLIRHLESCLGWKVY